MEIGEVLITHLATHDGGEEMVRMPSQEPRRVTFSEIVDIFHYEVLSEEELEPDSDDDNDEVETIDVVSDEEVISMTPIYTPFHSYPPQSRHPPPTAPATSTSDPSGLPLRSWPC